MGDSVSRSFFRRLEQPLFQLVAAAIAAIGSAIGAAVVSGAWAKVLGGVAAVAALALVATLVVALARDGRWQRGELDENRFQAARDQDVARRAVLTHERRIRRMLASAFAEIRDVAAARAQEQAMLEHLRRLISSSRRDAVDLLLLEEEADGRRQIVRGVAGVHDQAELNDPVALSDRTEARTKNEHVALFRVRKQTFRLVASSETVLGGFAICDIERAATYMQSLIAANQLRDPGYREGEAGI